MFRGPSRGPCIGIIYTHPFRVGGIQALFSPTVTPLFERGMLASFKGMQICNCPIPMSSLLFAYGNGPFSCKKKYLRLLQVLLLALAFWSFNFTSICAFGLLAYVGYILYAFPSLFQMHRLNGSLLVFILLWAASTYVFNVAFTFFNKRFQKVSR